MYTIEVFKTNVNEKREAKRIASILSQEMAAYTFSFDLDDCDRILRVVSEFKPIDASMIMGLLNLHNYDCQPLTD